MSILACPCGSADQLQSLETIQGAANLNYVHRLEDGSVDVDYAGYTEVDWDSQVYAGRFWCDACGSEFGAEALQTWVDPGIVEAQDDFLSALALLLSEGDDGLTAEHVAWALEDWGKAIRYADERGAW